VHIVVNRLPYFVKNAISILGPAPWDPDSEIPLEVTDFYSEQKIIEASDKPYDDRSPWMNRDLRAIRNKRKNNKTDIDEGCWLIDGIRCCQSMNDRVVLFATIDLDYPAFEDKCPGKDKSTSTSTELNTCPDPLAMEFSDEKVITGRKHI